MKKYLFSLVLLLGISITLFSQVSPNTWYVLNNLGSGKKISTAKKMNDRAVMTAQSSVGVGGHWRFIRQNNGFYRIQNKNSKKYLANFGSRNDGSNIMQTSKPGSGALWRIVRRGNSYLLQNYYTKFYIHQKGFNSGSPIVQKRIVNGSGLTQWKFIPVRNSSNNNVSRKYPLATNSRSFRPRNSANVIRKGYYTRSTGLVIPGYSPKINDRIYFPKQSRQVRASNGRYVRKNMVVSGRSFTVRSTRPKLTLSQRLPFLSSNTRINFVVEVPNKRKARPNPERDKFALRYGNQVRLFSHHKKYLVAERNGVLNANRTKAGPWETFTILNPKNIRDRGLIRYGSKVALKTYHNKYVVAESNGAANANRNNPGPWETFTIQKYGDLRNRGYISNFANDLVFRSYHNRYLVAEQNGTVNANRMTPSKWERFSFLDDARIPKPRANVNRRVVKNNNNFTKPVYRSNNIGNFKPRKGGKIYKAVVRYRDQIYISGYTPRVGQKIYFFPQRLTNANRDGINFDADKPSISGQTFRVTSNSPRLTLDRQMPYMRNRVNGYFSFVVEIY